MGVPAFSYGLDIGGTKSELAVFDTELACETVLRVPTPGDDYDVFLTTLVALVNEQDERLGSRGSLGIGLPGVTDQAGRAVSANVPCINGKPLVADLSAALERPVGFENDVNAFAFSESRGGAGQGQQRVLGLVLGTGVAGALCLDGAVYHGRQSAAGEFGHIGLPALLQQRYDLPLHDCACGLSGCVERYLSGPGLLSLSDHLGAVYPSVSSIVDALRAGEASAQEVFNVYCDCLGAHLAMLTLTYDPDVIVLGGGLSNIEELYPALPAAISAHLFHGISPAQVVPPRFGDSSGVRGAAILGREVARQAEGLG